MSVFFKNFAVALTIVVCPWSHGLALASSAEDLLHSFAKTRQFAEGQFTQVVVAPSGQIKQKGSGEFAFSRPGKFRWEIKKPYPQLIVADGKLVTNYDPDMQHATQKPMGNAMDSTPAALLFGSADLNKLFVIKEEGTKDGKQWLSAKPRDKENLFDTVRIGFENGLPVHLDIVDALGQTTKLDLTQWKFDARRPAAYFEFKTPPGVDLIQTQ
ncbi:outer membrane lipoprotein chaperone LolA [Limnobacter humi]|uniref:Outer-membrane lipoprotein carrier protein n=1 Tax=Limnobacter humi TaxID=1778671 RepID=A0ABT1WEV7_9BURK|nr:outer membrane lipoprotein chaperone LolA [Limnobacter humi]MCQ8896057.1 outer membrane lipoprotein chaperone LolA [Limnobacter humi]